jgi:hypothetical protein
LESKRQVFVAAVLLLRLPLLAALQYRWLGHVSDGEHEFLKANLRNAAERFSLSVDQEFTRLYTAFQEEPFNPELFGQPSTARYATRFAQWKQQTAHPQLFKALVRSPAAETPPLEFAQMQWQCLQAAAVQFAPCAWSAELQALRTGFESRLGSQRRAVEEPLIPRRFPEGLLGDVPALAFLLLPPPPKPQSFSNFTRAHAPADRFRPPFFSGLVVVVLNQTYVREAWLPGLIKQHFPHEATEYDIVIRSRAGAPRVMFSSGQSADSGEQSNIMKFNQPDVSTRLFGIRQELLRELLRDQWRKRIPPAPLETAAGSPPPGPFVMSLPDAEEGGQWQLLLQHRAGSLAAAVATARRRNLLLRFGILILTLSREQLLNELWGYDATPTTRTVDVHVGLLRQKLEPNPRLPQYILTIHGFGYKFVG